MNILTLLGVSKLDAIKAIQKAPGVPGMLRAAVAGALAGVSDTDFNYYGGLFRRVVSALNETESGRAILAEIGIGSGNDGTGASN